MPGVYISYPFCSQKCTFCNFSSGVFPADVEAQYNDVLLKQLRAHAWPWPPDTLYFGGGTPSLMPVDALHALICSVPLIAGNEVTLECAPGTLDRSRVFQWRKSGVNRVSLGVQSFVTAELRQTGRRHTSETVEQDVALLREAGIENINIDLIAGLPGQTRDSWRESLDWIDRLNPPHVSVYIFEIDEDSRLGKEALLGGIRYGASILPSEDAAAVFYELAAVRLAQSGIARYEISNFARPGSESRHNLKYWRLQPYLGFGLDAHSFHGDYRWSTTDDLALYLAQKEVPEKTESNLSEEHFFVGLRLSAGIQPTTDEWDRFARPIQKWTAAGMLERDGDRLRLTDRGVLLSNEVFQEFIDV